MIWYEGALRDHIALDPGRDREMAAKAGGGAGFVNGQEGSGLPALDPELRARHVRKFAGFVERKPALARLAREPALMALGAGSSFVPWRMTRRSSASGSRWAR